jgi:aminopeptidase N
MRRFALVALAACSATPHHTVPAPPPTTASSVAAQPPPDPEPPALRLPGDVKPERYKLELTIVPAEERAHGSVDIDAVVVRPTRIVWLNATNLGIAHAELGGKQARVIKGGEDYVGLTLDSELPAGPLAIDIAFDAGIDHGKSRGIYAEHEGSETYAYSFFEPIDARRAFPCFDEPSYKVPWQLTFHVKKDHVALANAPVVRETDEPDGMKRVETAETKPLPSYLVAFVVGPFDVIDDGVAGRASTPIRFIVPKGRAGELAWAKDVTPRVVAALEDYFAMDYPYGKLDVAVVPRYWGTMEHPGIVAMGQPLTLIRPEQATRRRKEHYANILAHELSHYWFGDYVTMAWWDDTWLNEALGEWSDLNITDAVEPSWHSRDSRVEIALMAMSADEALSTKPIRRSAETREAIAASFDNDITYYKGSSVLRMFEAYIGRDSWREFIRGYMHAHAWGNASAEQWLGELSAAIGAKASGFRSFLDQPGVPKIDVSCSPGKLAIHQQRALPAGVIDPSAHVWNVPVCMRYGDDKTAHIDCVQLDKADGELAVGRCPTWILPNADANGYYRSSIDPKVAAALLDPKSAIAKVAKPTAAEKLMLIADLRAMVARDEMSIDRLLSLAPLIANDPDPKVARWGRQAAGMHGTGLDDPLYAAANAYYVKAFGPLARSLGWHRARTDSDDRHDLRSSYLTMVARYDDRLGAEGEKLADRWIADRTGIEDDLVATALSVAAYRGDRARFDRYLAAAHNARDRTEQQRILSALGSFKDPKTALAALELVRGKDFDLRDTVGIMFGMLYTRETRDLGLAFVTQHIDELLGRMRADEAAGFLGAIAGAFCDPDRRAAVGDLVASRAAHIDGAQSAVARGLEQSDQCIAQVARDLPAIRRFLAK